MQPTHYLGLRTLSLTGYLALIFWVGSIELLIFGAPNLTFWFSFLPLVWLLIAIVHYRQPSELTRGLILAASGYLVLEYVNYAFNLSEARAADPISTLAVAVALTLLSVVLTRHLTDIDATITEREELEQQLTLD
jgi:hypothetical protein